MQARAADPPSRSECASWLTITCQFDRVAGREFDGTLSQAMTVFFARQQQPPPLSRRCGFVFACLFGWSFISSNIPAAGGASLLGQAIVPGRAAAISFPLDDYHASYAAQGGNPKPSKGRMVVAVPAGFDPARTWPILVINSTSDAGRTSPMDMWFYRDPVVREGWVVLASDAGIAPKHDTTEWRLAMLSAALQLMHKEWPRSAQWPTAFAGLSGGAKLSCALAGALAKAGGIRIVGVFLAGMNEDRLTEAYEKLKPPRSFLDVPVWLSCGSYDRIAPLARQEEVEASMRHGGFQHVRLESFAGRHEVSVPELQRALRWFRQLGRF